MAAPEGIVQMANTSLSKALSACSDFSEPTWSEPARPDRFAQADPAQPIAHSLTADSAAPAVAGRVGDAFEGPAVVPCGPGACLLEPRWHARQALALIVGVSLLLWALIVAIIWVV